jgi:hypothetical protein
MATKRRVPADAGTSRTGPGAASPAGGLVDGDASDPVDASADGSGSETASGSATSVGIELGRLVDTLQQWLAARSSDRGDASAVPGEHNHDHDHHDGRMPLRDQVCQVCPICQVAGLLDGSRADLTGALTEAAASVLTALRTAMDNQERQWSRRPRPGVERIDIS